MQFRCIITCVNYDDLLEITLPQAMYALATEPIVVTSMEDEGTLRCARKHGAWVFRTDRFYRNGSAFNKAAALNSAIERIRPSLEGWVLMLDSDIFLPDQTREALEAEATDKDCLYGAPRYHCPSKAAWDTQEFEPMTWKITEIPGYFHYFWAPNVARPWYDETYEHAGGYDSLFQKRWDKAHKKRLSFSVTHLGAFGQNWFGRRTKRWSGQSVGKPEIALIDAAFDNHEEMKANRVPAEGRRRAKIHGQ
jgi:hypothetical protein